jgi:hypothetical protein
MVNLGQEMRHMPADCSTTRETSTLGRVQE